VGPLRAEARGGMFFCDAQIDQVLRPRGEHGIELARLPHVVIHVWLSGTVLQQRRVGVDRADRVELDIGRFDVGANAFGPLVDLRAAANLFGLGIVPRLSVVTVGQDDNGKVEPPGDGTPYCYG
jgi:hypothetical protein